MTAHFLEPRSARVREAVVAPRRARGGRGDADLHEALLRQAHEDRVDRALRDGKALGLAEALEDLVAVGFAVGQGAGLGSKVGRAKAEGILLFSFGDASIATAMKQGGITRVQCVDNETLNVLGIYARYETVAYGD